VDGSTVRCTVGTVFPVRAANPVCSGFIKRRKAIRGGEGVLVEEGVAGDGDVEAEVREESRGKESRGKGREEVRREEGRGHGMIQ
jgi:hypothetical protein